MEFPPANPNLTEVLEASDAVRLRIKVSSADTTGRKVTARSSRFRFGLADHSCELPSKRLILDLDSRIDGRIVTVTSVDAGG
jgi:hypothetical protein